MWTGKYAPLQAIAPDGLPDALTDIWLSDYTKRWPTHEIVLTRTGVPEMAYLFDVGRERLIAAWGISGGKSHAPRNASRMAGSPRTGGTLYDRGHAIAHTMGGGLDINLVPQLSAVNRGAFRHLEMRAIAEPGSLYFTYWIYADGLQIPHLVEQGLVPQTAPPVLIPYPNTGQGA